MSYTIFRYGKSAHETHETHDSYHHKATLGGLRHEIMRIMCMKYMGGGGVYFF
jgi:hypothetical protein